MIKMRIIAFFSCAVIVTVLSIRTGATPNDVDSDLEGSMQYLDFNNLFLEYENTCRPNPCLNGGNCEEKDGDAICSCLPGFTGDRCEDSVCTTDYCKNGGNCRVESGEANCYCTEGFIGDQCELDDKCLPNPCSDHAIDCENFNNTNGYICYCEEGWIGDKCDLFDQCKNTTMPCQNDGICINDASERGYECLCMPYFYGDDCQIPDPCENPLNGGVNPCKNGGTCSFDEYFNVTCQCSPDYTGEFCEEKIECSPPCQNHGVCGTDPSNPDALVCYCPSGFFGEACEHNVCDSSPCYNGGTCKVDEFGQATCECLKGYNGRFCELNVCYPDNTSYCHNGGKCSIDDDGLPICECPPGLKGDQCDDRGNIKLNQI